MIVLSVTLVPFFHNARVYTAYEYLERRFDAKTRALTSFLFLVSRALAHRRGDLGAGGGAVGGAGAERHQHLPADRRCRRRSTPCSAACRRWPGPTSSRWCSSSAAWWRRSSRWSSACPTASASATRCSLAGETGRLQTFDFRFDLTDRYTFWSGTIAAFFLFCSYFGTDQSQVQRYLTAKSVDEARTSLLMSAYWKIPLQALVLLVGVLMFVFYVFTPPPMLFNDAHENRVRASARAADYAATEARFQTAFEQQREAAAALVRERQARRRRGLDSAQFLHATADDEDGPRRRRGHRQGRVRRRRLQRRQLRVPALRAHAPAGRPGRTAHRRDPRRRDVDDLGRTGRAVHRHGHRLLPALVGAGRAPTGSCSGCRGWPWASGGCSPAWWPSTPPTSARSSRWSTASARTSTARSSACSSWRLASRAPTGTARSSGSSAAWPRCGWWPRRRAIEFLWLNIVGAVAVCVVGSIVSAAHRRPAPSRRGLIGGRRGQPSALHRARNLRPGDGRIVGARRIPPSAQDDEATTEALTADSLPIPVARPSALDIPLRA